MTTDSDLRFARCQMGLAAAILLANACLVLADEKPAAGESVFGPGKMWQVRLTLTAEEFAAMQPQQRGGFPGFGAPAAPAKPADPNRAAHRSTFGADLPWAIGSIAIGDHKFANVGMRYKGNGTIL